VSHRVTVSPSEAADRLAIHELVEAYAHRDAKARCLFSRQTPISASVDERALS